MSTPELKPCLFCGGIAISDQELNQELNKGLRDDCGEVICQYCRASGGGVSADHAAVLEMWNRRNGMSFTPGPWKWYGHDGDIEIRPVAVREDVSLIAVLPLDSYADLKDWHENGESSDTMEANARLIAASPEMFKLMLDSDVELASFANSPTATEICNKIHELWRQITGIKGGLKGRRKQNELHAGAVES